MSASPQERVVSDETIEPARTLRVGLRYVEADEAWTRAENNKRWRRTPEALRVCRKCGAMTTWLGPGGAEHPWCHVWREERER